MEWYLIFKFLHVAVVVAWVGGGLALVILGIRADRANDTQEFIRIIQNVVYMAGRVFAPAGGLALVTGFIMLAIISFYMPLWVWLALIGWAATFAIGMLVLRSRSDEVVAIIARDGHSEIAVAKSRDILTIAKFDMVLLFVVTADMVLKPTFDNWIILIVMVLVLAGAGYFLVGEMVRPMIQKMMPPKAKA